MCEALGFTPSDEGREGREEGRGEREGGEEGKKRERKKKREANHVKQTLILRPTQTPEES